MRIIDISWIILFLSIILLIVNLFIQKSLDFVLFFASFVLIGINVYLLESHIKSLQKSVNAIKNIDLKPIEEGIKNIKNQRREYQMKLLELELNLEKLEKEREQKYRDVVRKVLELENKMNKEFKLLGEVVLKINREMEKD